jgi:hypothetical protein
VKIIDSAKVRKMKQTAKLIGIYFIFPS